MSGECLGRFGDFLGFFGIFLTYGTKSEQDGDNQAERSLGERCSLFRSLSGRASRSCNTKSDEKDRIGGGTPEVDGTTTEVGGEDPGQHDEDHLESRGNQTQGKGGIGLDAGLLEEVDGLVGNEVTSQVLGEVDTTDDHGAAKVDTLEQLNVVGLLGALLHLDNTTHHGNALLRVDSLLAAEACNGLGSLLELALAGQPPRRLGSEEDEDGERSGEHPLEGDGDPVSLVAGEGVVVVSDGADDDAANGPEHLQHLSRRSTELDGNDLRAVLKWC